MLRTLITMHKKSRVSRLGPQPLWYPYGSKYLLRRYCSLQIVTKVHNSKKVIGSIPFLKCKILRTRIFQKPLTFYIYDCRSQKVQVLKNIYSNLTEEAWAWPLFFSNSTHWFHWKEMPGWWWYLWRPTSSWGNDFLLHPLNRKGKYPILLGSPTGWCRACCRPGRRTNLCGRSLELKPCLRECGMEPMHESLWG